MEDLIFNKIKRMYDQALSELESLKNENDELRSFNKKLKNENKRLNDELKNLLFKSTSTFYSYPEVSFFERRVSERRKENITVEVDRRSGYDRRKGLRYVRPEFNMIFDDFYPKNKIIHPLVLKSDAEKIIDAYWELWHVILGYDLKKIKNIRDIYLVPEVRDEIIKSVDEKGFYKKGIAVSRSGGGRLIMDSIFIKDPESKQEYYVFLIIDEFQEG